MGFEEFESKDDSERFSVHSAPASEVLVRFDLKRGGRSILVAQNVFLKASSFEAGSSNRPKTVSLLLGLALPTWRPTRSSGAQTAGPLLDDAWRLLNRFQTRRVTSRTPKHAAKRLLYGSWNLPFKVTTIDEGGCCIWTFFSWTD